MPKLDAVARCPGCVGDAVEEGLEFAPAVDNVDCLGRHVTNECVWCLVVPTGWRWRSEDDLRPHRDDDVPNTIGEVDGPIVVRVHSLGVRVPDRVRASISELPIGGVVEWCGGTEGVGPPNCR